jgi:transposase InsO family protein
MVERKVKIQLANELHKPARVNYNRRKVIMKGIDDLWQIDLVEMHQFSKQNNKFNYLLTVIDTFSKYSWAIPLKRKTAKIVSEAMEKLLKTSKRVPKNIQSDMGKEFYNSEFQNVMKKYNINHYSTYSYLKASICERFNRTLKAMMWKQFTLQGNHKWLQILPDILETYNNRKHTTIKMQPSQVNKKNEKHILLKWYARF